ncbi:type II toxin-antitoxin system RatA family toxin [Amycolatopsis sp. NPDC059657]|uniref:type II toxin-antitoxin system RatA family toxin n=1 Tax=Amycolatopsis sp. NPDC059657 TaxID=3346899 RepID=UPI00366FF377
MPIVYTSVDIADATLDHVWDVVCAFDRYPPLMPDVLEVNFLERSETEAVSAWRVLLNGSEMTWEERDVFVPKSRIDFEQIDGDLEVFRGSWLLSEIEGGVRVSLSLEFDMGIPSLAAVLDPIGIQAIESNSRTMLTAISEQREPVTHR